MPRLTQYQRIAQVGPLSGSFKERTTPDKYIPNEPKTFVRPSIAAAALLATTTALAFVPFADGVKKNWQEKPQADKIYAQIERPVKRFDLTRAQYSYYETRGGLFFVPFADGVKKNWQENPQADKWWQLPNQPLFDAKRSQYDTPSYFTADRQQVPDLDSWVPGSLQPQFDQRRTQFVYPVSALPDRQAEPDLDSWFQPASEFLRQIDGRILRAGDSAWSGFTPISVEQIFADKWHPASNIPGFDKNRRQSVYSFSALPDQQQVPDLDSWVPLANQPQFDLKRAQFEYPYYGSADQQPVPLALAYVQSADPHFDLKRTQYLLARTEWTSTFTANRVFPDSWHPEVKPPQFDLRRTQFIDPSYFGPDRQSEPRVDSWWQQLSEAVRLPDRRVQWQGFTILGVPPSEDIEEVSPDRWQPLSNQPLFDVKRSQYLSARSEWTSTLTANRVFPDSWHPEVKGPQFDLRRWQVLYPVLAFAQFQFAERSTIDKYAPLDNLPRWDVKRIQAEYPSFIVSEEQPLPRTEAWHAPIAQPQFDLKRTQFSLPFLAFSQISFAERTTPDKYVPLVNLPRWDAIRSQFLAAKTEWVSTFTSNRVFPDSWHPESNKPQFDLRRIQALYPAFSGADRQPQPRVDSWWQQTSEYLRQTDRRVLRTGASELDLTPQEDVERTSVDRYDPGTQQPQFDKKRTQATYEFNFFYPQPFSSPIFAERWHPASNLPIFPLDRRIQFFGDSELTLAATQRAERSTPDKWHPAIEQRLRQVAGSLPESYPAPFTPRAIFVDSWWQQTNEQIRSAGNRRHLLEFFTSGTQDQERTTPDKYDPGIRQPLFDLARKQYLAQTFGLAERQPEPRFDSWYQPLSERVREREPRQYIAPSAVHPDRQPVITADWLIQASEPLRRQTGTLEVVQNTPFTPERITVDKWQGILDARRSDTITREYLLGAIFTADRQPEIRLDWFLVSAERLGRLSAVILPVESFVFHARTITVDQWKPTADVQFHAIRGTTPGTSSFAPEIQSVARLDSWNVSAPDVGQSVKQAPAKYSAYPIESTSKVSVDGWHPTSNQPLFSVYRTQYGYLVTSLPSAPPVPSRPGIVLISSSTARVSANSDLTEDVTTGSAGAGISISSKVTGTADVSSEVASIRIKSEPKH